MTHTLLSTTTKINGAQTLRLLIVLSVQIYGIFERLYLKRLSVDSYRVISSKTAGASQLSFLKDGQPRAGI